MEELQHPYLLRTLQQSDFHKGYLQLLEQLTKVGNVSEEEFTGRLEQIQNSGDHHRIAVIEDVDRKLVVGAGTLFVELKFGRNCGKVGHIEDVVVDQSVRGQHLGQRVVYYLTEFAKEQGCYKVTLSTCVHTHRTGSLLSCRCESDIVILDCSKDNAPFYEKCGFHQKELQMARYL